MVASKKEGSDRGDSSHGSRETDGSTTSGRRVTGGLTERLRDVLRGESDGDLILDRGDIETGVVRWLRALDLHFLGACRADERLKPLLKLDISNGVAEDRLLIQLSQHFEASEVGMLARCLCVPLVSIRVGKVNKQGNLLCPSTTRGQLNLTLLPSSNMRISFVGDNGCTERLAVLTNNIDSSGVSIEEISADSSGRSFLLKLPGSQILYFWCSEKSKLHGMELLAKMKDLLSRKPTLSHLTGIRESRLESFAAHLRTYLLGLSNIPEADALPSSCESPTDIHATGSISNIQAPPPALKSSRCHFRASHTLKESLSPRPITFKDGTIRSSSSIKSGIRENLSQYGDNNSPTTKSTSQSDGCTLLPLVTQSEISSLSSSLPSPISLFPNLPPPEISASKSSKFSPFYCWCPPCPSALQLPVTFNDSIPLPPLSSLFSSGAPVPAVASNLPLNLSEPIAQQISTFTPFMSDPIVHTPVIDVCSSGQGYLVSAGPAISSAVPPLLPGFVSHPLVSETESAVEKSARETLRMLMASTPTFISQKPVNVFPPFLDKVDANFSVAPGNKHGSQGLNRGTLDFKALAMNLSSAKEKVVGDGVRIGESDISDGVDDLASTIQNSKGCDFAENRVSEREPDLQRN